MDLRRKILDHCQGLATFRAWSIYRALAEHEKAQAYPEAVEAARADFAALQAEGQGDDIPQPRHPASAVNL